MAAVPMKKRTEKATMIQSLLAQLIQYLGAVTRIWTDDDSEYPANATVMILVVLST